MELSWKIEKWNTKIITIFLKEQKIIIFFLLSELWYPNLLNSKHIRNAVNYPMGSTHTTESVVRIEENNNSRRIKWQGQPERKKNYTCIMRFTMHSLRQREREIMP